MKLELYKKLKQEIKDQDFHDSYSKINKILYTLSFFGNIASIFFAYFFLSKILIDSVTIIKSTFILSGISLMLLSFLELIKREIFDKFSMEFLKAKGLLTKEVLSLIVFTCIIIFMSFYASLNGAHKFTDKSKTIDLTVSSVSKNYQDSLNKVNNIIIIGLQNEISSLKEKDSKKDEEQTSIESSSDALNRNQKNRVKDLKTERSEIKSLIKEKSIQIDTLNSQVERKALYFQKEQEKLSLIDKDENKSNSFIFVVVSTIIELTILIGIFFNKYFKYKTFEDYSKKLENDPNIMRWKNCQLILDYVYTDTPKIGERISAMKNIFDLIKASGEYIQEKEISESLKLITHLKILKLSGNNRFIAKDKEEADLLLKTHFGLK